MATQPAPLTPGRATDMYTQCPHCQAFFQVSAEHLKAADGDVRCGQCLTVFNALSNLSEAFPPQTVTQSFEPEPSPDASATGDNTETEHPHGDEPKTASRAEQALEALLKNSAPAAEPEPYDLGEIDDVTAPLDARIEEYNAAPAEEMASEPLPEKAIIISEDDLQQHNTANRNAAAPETVDEETESLAAFFADAHEESGKTPADSATPAIETQTPPSPAPDDTQANVPVVILQQLQEEKAARLQPSSTPWVVGNLFLMLVLVAQAVYFQRDQLVRDPLYRDWIIKACEVTSCTLAVPYDVKQIDIISRDVRSHPSAKNGLIAATTLINNAAFPQPFPLLTLTFSDINGTRLAQRRFTPSEYLDTHTDADAGMPPDMPVQIELELVDPGKAAVNFEFRAERDPRSDRWRGNAG